MIQIQVEDLNCPKCEQPHTDIDQWAIDPHRTHLCLHCGELFKGSVRGVSRPEFQNMHKPDDVVYVTNLEIYAKIQAKSEELADLIIGIPAGENLKIGKELEILTGLRLEDLHLMLSRLSQLLK